MTPDTLAARRENMDAIIRVAGQKAADYFRRRDQLQIESKSLQDFVSEADRQVELFLRQAIQTRWPQDRIVGEEFGTQNHSGDLNSDFTWVIDPIDGTGNFIRGIPLYCVLVALVYQGRTVCGWTLDPERDEMFFACAGEGATLNGEVLTAGKTTSLQEAVIATGVTFKGGQEHRYLLGKQLLAEGIDYRRLGSAGIGLAWTAAGRVDGFFEGQLNAWDALAGLLLNQEAGNTILEPDQSFLAQGGKALAAAPALYQALNQLTR
ncbi:inositol monophosphatase family protein [Parendozoicomonas haliclonae]|uniref:Inositol-1-monophosphatase n=1 Tax=Parendozoicomonas haliclonae TaxID=1960125 RepID=A0A1X7AGW4_9GAMM|nr:inositol monophosphatase [Parendozoicomonas haliclonae]SMA39623.1 Inositol-1-monophosphatase [Parendozoicomonas haliclonae]